jgi:chaperonin GroEL (HSP60 family)
MVAKSILLSSDARTEIIGNMVAEAMERVGKEGVITIADRPAGA